MHFAAVPEPSTQTIKALSWVSSSCGGDLAAATAARAAKFIVAAKSQVQFRRDLVFNIDPAPAENFCAVTSSHDHNRKAWDARVRTGGRFTKPASDDEFSNPLATVDPAGWLGSSIAGRRVLCLASGGGRQVAPLYAAAAVRACSLPGASVTLDPGGLADGLGGVVETILPDPTGPPP